MAPSITGIHHVTAIASDPQRNLDFYRGFLGLRLVKKTVNFDDPGTYHFYFGDDVGSPGSILTFFPWPSARRGRHGSGEVLEVSFVVRQGSLEYWKQRTEEYRVPLLQTAPDDRFGEQILSFTDPDGMQISLIEMADVAATAPVTEASVDPAHAVIRFHSATLAEEGFERTAELLTTVMGFRLVSQHGNRFRFEAGSGGPANMIDVLCTPDLPRGTLGAGSVHHIAWRTPDDDQQGHWHSELVGLNYNVSPIMDRKYFHSIYYREPGGILFEIATDPPGFAIDESVEQLGSALKLPPQYERMRSQIEAMLPAVS